MLLATLLTAAAEEATPPLIDVDGTLLVQFALFLIMLVILSRALFRPYLNLRDARHKGIEGAREEAHGMDGRVQAIIGDYDTKLSAAKLRGNEERQRLRTEGAIHERQVLGKARDEAQRALEGARGKISSEASAARVKLEAESTTLAKDIVKKVLGREVA
jgi:F0F1-type ATP synthase membrane subunit b/b'